MKKCGRSGRLLLGLQQSLVQIRSGSILPRVHLTPTASGVAKRRSRRKARYVAVDGGGGGDGSSSTPPPFRETEVAKSVFVVPRLLRRRPSVRPPSFSPLQ